MPLVRYEPKNFRGAARQTINHCNRIIAEYAAQGYDLTVRQLYYQFVSRDLIRNTQSEYKRLAGIISDARLAGLIDWNSIVDRTRNVRRLSHWDSPRDIIRTTSNAFNIDRWEKQPIRIMCLIEKDALVGVFEPVCQEYDVPLLSCRGYTSQSEMWSVAQTLGGYLADDQRILILHFGDHDPSGLDMTRDIRERLQNFLFTDWVVHERKTGGDDSSDAFLNRMTVEQQAGNGWHQRIEVRRMALTYDQIGQYNPPPNPAKETDVRFAGYQRQYGDESWELDALEPTVLGDLVRRAIESEYDLDLWNDAEQEERDGRRRLKLVADRWDDIQTVLDKKEST